MKEFQELTDIIKTLRGKNGCDWDKKQTLQSMKKYVLEEVYELFEAIDEGNHKELQEEIGDICMHMVFLSQIAAEKNLFSVEDVLKTINNKLIRRHPHVFGNAKVDGVDDILQNWEKIKQTEKKERKYLLDGIPKNMPAMNRAQKIQEKLDRLGFNWGDLEGIIDKVEEELEELKVEIKANDMKKAELEMGDVFFVLTNLTMRLGLDPDQALQKTNNKTISRMKYIEDALKKENKELEQSSLLEIESLWQKSKKEEKI